MWWHTDRAEFLYAPPEEEVRREIQHAMAAIAELGKYDLGAKKQFIPLQNIGDVCARAHYSVLQWDFYFCFGPPNRISPNRLLLSWQAKW